MNFESYGIFHDRNGLYAKLKFIFDNSHFILKKLVFIWFFGKKVAKMLIKLAHLVDCQKQKSSTIKHHIH